MEASEKIETLPILRARLREFESFPSVSNFYRDYLKRVFDIVLSALALPFVLPVLLTLMALIKLTSKGPAIFKSQRIGKFGKKFYIYKLRTMCTDADEKLVQILAENSEFKEEWEKDQKLKNDPRITKIGKFARALSLDELPQVFNVLKGEMSLVGPRPIVEDEIKKYGSQFRDYTQVKPGITGLWQVSGRNDVSYIRRVSMDTSYVKQATLSLDLKIITKTIPVALSKKGAY